MGHVWTETGIRDAWRDFAFDLRATWEHFGYSVSQGNNGIRFNTAFDYGHDLSAWAGGNYPRNAQGWVPEANILGRVGSYANAGVVLQSAFSMGTEIVCNGFFNINAPTPADQGYFISALDLHLFDLFLKALLPHSLSQSKKRKSGVWVVNTGQRIRDIRRVPI